MLNYFYNLLMACACILYSLRLWMTTPHTMKINKSNVWGAKWYEIITRNNYFCEDSLQWTCDKDIKFITNKKKTHKEPEEHLVGTGPGARK